jgi:hypothetical protein
MSSDLPPQLRRVLADTLPCAKQSSVSWQKQLAAIEQRRLCETECLLQTALAKLSRYDDVERDARLHATDVELERLHAMLVQPRQ